MVGSSSVSTRRQMELMNLMRWIISCEVQFSGISQVLVFVCILKLLYICLGEFLGERECHIGVPGGVILDGWMV